MYFDIKSNNKVILKITWYFQINTNHAFKSTCLRMDWDFAFERTIDELENTGRRKRRCERQ